MLKLLTFSSLYPNREQIRHGIFVEQRLRHLLALGDLRATVVAPVPWFPWRADRFGGYARYARVPKQETRHGVVVHHPRYPVIPKLGMSLAPLLLATALYPRLKQLEREVGFDLIDAHYYYPDGVAAVLLGRWLGKPVAVTARGSDLRKLPDYRIPGKWLKWAIPRADLNIAVSGELHARLLALGAEPSRCFTFRNGVDLTLFSPDPAREKKPARKTGAHLLSVGNLVAGKGHHLVVEALRELPGCTLTLIGEGPERERLARQIETAGLARRVRLLPAMEQAELARYYREADVLVLASSSEGMPNVVLEAMACGTPVIATDVGGIPEILETGVSGLLIHERTPAAIAHAVRCLLEAPLSGVRIRRHAERFSWEETVQQIRDRFLEQVARHRP